MGRMGFYYDQTRCVGCNACQIACKDYHDLEKGLVYRRVSTWEIDTEEKQTVCLHYSGACNHCSDALCIKNCPVQAIHQNADGTVVQDRSACIGCGTCTWVCPYGAPSLSRMSGTAAKCDGCYERRAQGKEPVCVEACITHCLQFGDLDELSKGHETVRELPFLPKADLTDPAIAIRPRQVQAQGTCVKDVSAVNEKEEKKVSAAGKRCVILGGGIAGVTAAETVRAMSDDIEIVMVSAEAELPYSRPLLSKTYIKSLDASKILLKPASWYEEQKIKLVTEAVVAKLNPETKTVILEDGSEYSYDICIYALGASPWTPPMEGLPMKGVYCIRTAEDVDQVHQYMSVSEDAIVLGGGVIGLEMAEELRQMGLNVTILEAAPRLMGRLLDEESSRVLKEHLISEGVRVEEGVIIARVEADDNGRRLASVTLKDGRNIKTGVLVVSCGIRANIAVAQDAGLACERGVVVDGNMKTSADGIYAAGDCISFNGRNPGLWGFSRDTAEMAARSAVLSLTEETVCNAPYVFTPDVMMSTGGISIFSAGTLETGEGVEVTYGEKCECCVKEMQEFAAEACYETRFLVNHRDGEKFSYQKYYRKNGKLVGVVLMGDLSDLAKVKKELQEGGLQ